MKIGKVSQVFKGHLVREAKKSMLEGKQSRASDVSITDKISVSDENRYIEFLSTRPRHIWSMSNKDMQKMYKRCAVVAAALAGAGVTAVTFPAGLLVGLSITKALGISLLSGIGMGALMWKKAGNPDVKEAAFAKMREKSELTPQEALNRLKEGKPIYVDGIPVRSFKELEEITDEGVYLSRYFFGIDESS